MKKNIIQIFISLAVFLSFIYLVPLFNRSSADFDCTGQYGCQENVQRCIHIGDRSACGDHDCDTAASRDETTCIMAPVPGDVQTLDCANAFPSMYSCNSSNQPAPSCQGKVTFNNCISNYVTPTPTPTSVPNNPPSLCSTNADCKKECISNKPVMVCTNPGANEPCAVNDTSDPDGTVCSQNSLPPTSQQSTAVCEAYDTTYDYCSLKQYTYKGLNSNPDDPCGVDVSDLPDTESNAQKCASSQGSQPKKVGTCYYQDSCTLNGNNGTKGCLGSMQNGKCVYDSSLGDQCGACSVSTTSTQQSGNNVGNQGNGGNNGGGSSGQTGQSDCTYNQDCKKSDNTYAQQTCKGKKDSSNTCKYDSNVDPACTACGTVTASTTTSTSTSTSTSSSSDCKDNPPDTQKDGNTPAGYYWKADCSKSCTITADKPHGDCPTNTLNSDPNKTAWCYGFQSGAKCLQLTAGSPSSGSSCTVKKTVCDTDADHSCNKDWCDTGSGKYNVADKDHTNKDCKKYGDPNNCKLCDGGWCNGGMCGTCGSGSGTGGGASGTGGGAGGVGGGSSASGSCSQGASCDVPACNSTVTDPATGKPGTPGTCSACDGKWCNGGKCECGGKTPPKPEVTAAPGSAVPTGALSSEYPDYYTDGTACTGKCNGNFASCAECGHNPCKCVGGGGGNCPHYCWYKQGTKPGLGGGGGGGGGGGTPGATTGPGTPSPTLPPSCDDKKLNLVIFGDGYSSADDIALFKKEATSATSGPSGLLSTEPYPAGKDTINVQIVDLTSDKIKWKDATKKTFGCLKSNGQYDHTCTSNADVQKMLMDSTIALFPSYKQDQAHLKTVLLVNGKGETQGDLVSLGNTQFGGQYSVLETQEDLKKDDTDHSGFLKSFIHEVGGHEIGELYDRYVQPGYVVGLVAGGLTQDGVQSNCTDKSQGENFWNDVRKSIGGQNTGATPTPTGTAITPTPTGATPTATPTGTQAGQNAFLGCMNPDIYAPVAPTCNTQTISYNGKSYTMGIDGSPNSIMSMANCSTRNTFDAYEQSWIKNNILTQYACHTGTGPLDNLQSCYLDPECVKKGSGHVCVIICQTPTPAPATTATPTGTISPTVTPTGSITPTVTHTPVTVSIKNNAFVQNSVTVSVGNQVTWTNNDSVDHTVTFDDNSFDKTVSAGQSVSKTFTTAGTYTYYCKIHTKAVMSGTVVVK